MRETKEETAEGETNWGFRLRQLADHGAESGIQNESPSSR